MRHILQNIQGLQLRILRYRTYMRRQFGRHGDETPFGRLGPQRASAVDKVVPCTWVRKVDTQVRQNCVDTK
jgi:hypothetical protein